MTDTTNSVTGALPERDTTKTAEQQGLFRKFDVRRVDGSDQLGGKHHGCRYYVLDVDHDPYAAAALGAYADACKESHPELARDLREKWGAADTLRAQLAEAQRELIAKEAERAGMELERNNAQRQHTTQCAINKADSQRILELTSRIDKLTAENELLREQRNRVGLYIDHALRGGQKDDHEAGLSGRMDAIRALRTQLAEAQREHAELDARNAAVIWLYQRAADQACINATFPRHAAYYTGWVEAQQTIANLAEELDTSPLAWAEFSKWHRGGGHD